VNGDDDPGNLLDVAEGLLHRTDPATAGLWPRVSALLALRALEAALWILWERRALALQSCSMRAQLICLRTYLGDVSLAARTGHASSALRRACHHHPYDLAPTAAELEGWFTVVRELAERVRLPHDASNGPPAPARS
jgi:hypothetical protein